MRIGPDLGEFTIDPRSPAYKYTKDICEPGNPAKCMIYNMSMLYLKLPLRVHVNHLQLEKSWYSLTHGGYVWTKPMPEPDRVFGANFDLGKTQRKAITVSLDLSDGTWAAKPSATHAPHKRSTKGDLVRQGSKHGLRSRQLAMIRKSAQLPTAGRTQSNG